MLQRGRSPGEAVPVVLVTHETRESRDARGAGPHRRAGRRAGTARVIRIEPA